MAPKHISYRLMRRRMRRTLNYGENRRMDHLSLPLTELAADYFDKHAPFDYLDMDYATNLSREGCVDPCTLIVALVYLDRVRLNDQQYFETTDPANLYLAALIVASKFLHDDGNADFVYNDEWAASASTTLKHVNEQEINMLNGLNWNLLVNAEDFGSALRSVESHLARKSLLSRGYATYSDLRVLSRHLAETNYLWQQFLQPLLTLFGLASLAYTATVFGLFGASLHLRGLSASTGMTSCDKPTLPI
uniref:Protein CNPPD1 n=1 Tax=Plectus sambesii TaxID=2011161 RepID=A0A914W5D6_9BILA